MIFWWIRTRWDGLSAGNDGSENVTLHGNTKGDRNDIEQEEVGGLGGGGLSGEDTGLDGGTVGSSLVGVDALLELLATEEVAEELLDLGDTGGTTNKTISSTLLLSMAASFMTWATGSRVPAKAFWFRSSKRARVMLALKSSPSNSESISTVV